MKSIAAPLALVATLLMAPTPHAADLDVKPNDSMEAVLTAQKGKRVMIRTRSGLEVTGTVKSISARLVHIAQLVGKEFYDAVVPLEAVDAVVIRTKD